MQFVEDDDTDLSQVTPESVLELFSSVNTPLVAMPGRSSEEIRAYVLAHRGLGKTVEMHVYLHVISSNESYVYSYSGNPFPPSEYENVKALSLDFVETIGFIMDSNTFGGLNQEARIQLFREAPFTLAPAHSHMQEVDADVPLDLLREKPMKPAGDTDFQMELKVPPPGAAPPQDSAPLDIGFDDGSGNPADELYEAGLDDSPAGDTIPNEPDPKEELPDDLFESDTPLPKVVAKAPEPAPLKTAAPTDVEIDMEGPGSADSESPVESVAWDEPEPAALPPPGIAIKKQSAEVAVSPAVPPAPSVEVEVDIEMEAGPATESAPPEIPVEEPGVEDSPLVVAAQDPPSVEVDIEMAEASEATESPEETAPSADVAAMEEPEVEPEMEDEGVGGIRMDTGDEEERDDSESDEPINPGPDRHEGRFLTPKSRWTRRQPLFYGLDEPSPTEGRANAMLEIPALEYKDERQKALSELLASL